MLDRSSRFFFRAMMRIFMALVSLGILVGSVGLYGERPSYSLALAVAALGFGLLLWLAPRLRGLWGKLLDLGKVKLGIMISLVCLLVNGAWILYFSIEPSVDFLTFYETAQSLSQGKTIDWLYIGLFPHILGYSTFLAWFMERLGDFPLLAPMVNLGLTMVSGICIYVLCLRHVGLGGAVLAYLMWALLPSKMIYNSMVMSEPLYTCLILVFMLLISFASGLKLPLPVRMGLALGLGLLAGAVLLGIQAVRPVGTILLVAYLIWLLLLRGRELKRAAAWAVLILFTLGLFTGYSYCDGRWDRWKYFKLYEETSDLPAYNIYVGLNMDSMGSFSEEDMDLLLSYRYDEEKGSAVYAQEQMLEHVKERLKDPELDLPRLLIVKLGKLLGSDEGGAFYGQAAMSQTQFSLWSAVSNVYYYLLFLLAMLGGYRLIRRPELSPLALAPLYAIGLMLAHMVVEVSGRYKYSIIPMLIIVAAFSLDMLFRTTKQKIP